MASVFISYSSHDRAFARRLAADLGRRAITVWMDVGEMQPGDSLIYKLQHAIQQASYVAVVLSPDSVVSPWVKKEVEIAMVDEINGHRVKVIPLIRRECNVPPFLATKVWVDFSKPRSYRAGVASLVRRLTGDLMRAHLSERPPISGASDHDPLKWTPKAVRLGLSCGLLRERDGCVELSDEYVRQLCLQAREAVTGRRCVGKDVWSVLHLHAAGKAKGPCPATTEADFIYFITEVSGLPFTRHLVRVGLLASILESDGSVFRPSVEFVDEFLEVVLQHLADGRISDNRSAQRLTVRTLLALVKARLLMNQPGMSNYAHLLAMFLNSALGFSGVVTSMLAEIDPGTLSTPEAESPNTPRTTRRPMRT